MRAEVKQWAKEHRDGNKWNIWQVFLVVGLISGFASGIVNGIFPSTPEEPNMIASGLNAVIATYSWTNFLLSKSCKRKEI